jgi:hypothetical protein
VAVESFSRTGEMPLCRSLAARKQRNSTASNCAKNGLTSDLDAQTGLATNLNADLNELAGRVNLTTWPNTSPEVVPDVQATWESHCGNRDATLACKLSTGAVRNAATDSLGY